MEVRTNETQEKRTCCWTFHIAYHSKKSTDSQQEGPGPPLSSKRRIREHHSLLTFLLPNPTLWARSPLTQMTGKTLGWCWRRTETLPLLDLAYLRRIYMALFFITLELEHRLKGRIVVLISGSGIGKAVPILPTIFMNLSQR